MTKAFTLNLRNNRLKYGRGLAALLALVFFLPALATWFTGEDFSFILPASTGKPFYQAWQNLFYRPLPNLLWQFDYTVWGLSATGYHLTNLIIHAANAWLVGWLLRKYLNSDFAGFVAALLFALTPVHTEPVVWLAGRPDLLATFFGLLTLILSQHFAETKKGWVYALDLLAFGAAIFSKESVAGIPFILVGLDLIKYGWPRAAQNWRGLVLKFLPFFLVEGVYWVVRYVELGSLGSYGNGGWLNIPWNLTVGLWQPLLFPFNFDSAGWLVGGMLSALLLVFYGWLLLAIVRNFSFKGHLKSLALPLLVIYGGLAPALTLAPVGLDLSQARLLYLPSVGFCWLLALLIRLRLQLTAKGESEQITHPAPKGTGKTALNLVKVFLVLVPVLIYAAGLYLAFTPWLEAGSEAKATFDQLHKAGLPFQPGDYIYYEGLPDSYHGAYIWRNGLDEASTLLLGPGINGTRRLPDQLIDYGKTNQGRVWFVRFASSQGNASLNYLFSYNLSTGQNAGSGHRTGEQNWNLESCQAGEWKLTPTQGAIICQQGQGLYLQTGWQKTSLSLTSPTLKPPANAMDLEISFANYVDFDFQQPQIFSDLTLTSSGKNAPFQQPFELAGDGKLHQYRFYVPLSTNNQGDLHLTFDFNKFRSTILWKAIEIQYISGQ